MNDEILTEAENGAALARLASIQEVEPGSTESEAMMKLVTIVADHVADRDLAGVVQS